MIKNSLIHGIYWNPKLSLGVGLQGCTIFSRSGQTHAVTDTCKKISTSDLCKLVLNIGWTGLVEHYFIIFCLFQCFSLFKLLILGHFDLIMDWYIWNPIKRLSIYSFQTICFVFGFFKTSNTTKVRMLNFENELNLWHLLLN